jgi:DNA polymerase III epsilon subunit-like protein
MNTDAIWTDTRLMVVDVEGNGAQPPRLVEFAAVPIADGRIGEPESWLIRPATRITWQATRVHGITNDTVADLPTFDAVADDVRAHLDGAVIVAHNAHVDIDVLTRELPGWQPAAVIDTLRLARAVLPDQASYRLGVLVDMLNLATGLPPALSPHRATYDAMVCARLLINLAGRLDVPTLRNLITPSGSTTPTPDALF